jgi:acyl-CoA dehydrogenase
MSSPHDYNDIREAVRALCAANMARYLAATASWVAANACIHGGFGFACEDNVERKFRETRPHLMASISISLILSYIAEPAFGLPRSC